MNIATYENLVEEVLDKLLLERSRGEQTVEISAEEFGDEVAIGVSVRWRGSWESLHVLERRNEDVAQADNLLLLGPAARVRGNTHILVPQMLQELQFSVCALRQNRSAEGLHDLLDGNGLAGELVLCRTGSWSVCSLGTRARCTYQTRPNAPMPTGCRSVYLQDCQFAR